MILIFDLDGTLLDTLDDLAASTNHALRTFGMPEHSRDDVRRFVGNGVRVLMERAVPGGASNPQFEEVLAEFKSYYLQHGLEHTRPYPGIMETLAELKRRGCRIAVVSNKFFKATQELCQHFFPGLVEVAIGEREDIRRKPAPDTVLEALRLLGERDEKGIMPAGGKNETGVMQAESKNETGIMPTGEHDAYYIGDSDVDIETARNSGLPCISVLWGFRDRDFLMAHGASRLVSAPAELLALPQGDVAVQA